MPSAAPVACLSSVPDPGASTPAGAASATASPSRRERAQESSRPEKRRRWSPGRERSRSGGKCGGGQSRSPARSACLASVSASSSSESSDLEGRVSAMPPLPSSRPGPGLYTVPPGLASSILYKVSESRKHSVSLSHSLVSSLETMLSSVCEVTSWLDWWLSTCGGFREHLPAEVHGNFEQLMLSGSRALEFLGFQGVTTLGNLVLSHRDSLLLDARSTVPAEEIVRFALC